MNERLITSAANPRLKQVLALRRRRARDDSGLTLLEGYDELRLALEAGVRPRQLLYCPELMHDAVAQLHEIPTDFDRIQLSRNAFEKVAYREGADGFLAVVAAPGVTLQELPLGENPLVLIAEGVEKPGNLGAMLRTADAAGVDAVLAADPRSDWGNPNVIRSSKGTVFSVPVASAASADTMHLMRERGITVVAATPDTELTHMDCDLTGPVAIAVGTEKEGLSGDFLAAADARVRIPMVGKANSLNVATSAAIILFEAVRQRQHG